QIQCDRSRAGETHDQHGGRRDKQAKLGFHAVISMPGDGGTLRTVRAEGRNTARSIAASPVPVTAGKPGAVDPPGPPPGLYCASAAERLGSAARALSRPAPIAQLDRALPSEGRGQRFESSWVRHLISEISTISFCS